MKTIAWAPKLKSGRAATQYTQEYKVQPRDIRVVCSQKMPKAVVNAKIKKSTPPRVRMPRSDR